MNDTALVSTFTSVNASNLEDRLEVSIESLNLIDSILDGTISVFSMTVSLVDGVPYETWLSSLSGVIGNGDDEIFGIKRIYVIAAAAALVLILILLLICMFFSGCCKCCGCCCKCEERKTEHQKRAHSTYVSFLCVCVYVCHSRPIHLQVQTCTHSIENERTYCDVLMKVLC